MFDFCVVGGGIVGVAILRELSLCGQKCLLLEKDELISGASAKNSGICHSGYDNDGTVTPIENKCIKKGYQELLKLHHNSNLPLKKTGALLCAWTEEELKKLPEIIKLANSNDIMNVKIIESKEMLKLEPNLNPNVLGGIEIKGEFIVDPWVTPILFILQSLKNGSKIIKNSKVTNISKENISWKIETWNEIEKKKEFFESKNIINCAGLFGDDIENYVKESTFEMRPRKGQFLVLKDSNLFERIILPVWNDRTKGVLISNTVYGNTIIGPTAEEQTDRYEAKVDNETLSFLFNKGKEITSKLKESNIIGSYAGLRPATQHKDYQISFDLTGNWISISGIRSTGLSSALGIADLVSSNLKLNRQKSENKVFEEASEILQKISQKLNQKNLNLGNETYPITHPITIFGLKSKI
jgi:glycerol-3-phosphate dehydrogenase